MRGRLAITAGVVVLALACAPKKLILLSPEDDYSDDPELVVKVQRIVEATAGRTEVTLSVDNKHEASLPLGEATVTLIDASEKPMPLLSRPAEPVPAGQTRVVAFAFDTSTASKGAFEMRMSIPGSKVWPIVFSQEKPPEFKPTPEPQQGQPPGFGGPSPY